MERSEPSLAPEWLKGGSGSCTSLTPCPSEPQLRQDESGGSVFSRQRSQLIAGSNTDYNSPRYSSVSDRVFHPVPRRVLSGSNSLNERGFTDSDVFSQPRPHSSYGRSVSFRSSDGSEREQEGRKGGSDYYQDWECDQSRETEKDMTLGWGNGNVKDREHERQDDAAYWRHRYDLDLPLKRSQSLGPSNKSSENGTVKQVTEEGSLLGGPLADGGTLTRKFQKAAAFDRNFPSLGIQDKPGVLQSSLGDVSGLSTRSFWQQGSSSKVDGGRASPGMAGTGLIAVSGLPGGIAMTDGWNSVLGEAPTATVDVLASNGLSFGTQSKVLPGTVPGLIPGAAQGAPKMAEALLQNPPRVKTPPQLATETRLEELALRQSRQLIPMKPSFPKTMGQNLSPRDKSKPKIGRTVDVILPNSLKLNHTKVPSQPSSPLHYPSVPTRLESTKQSTGMLVVSKTSKEAVLAAMPATLPGSLDVSGPTLVAAFNSADVAVFPGSSNTPNLGAPVHRKPKHSLEPRAAAKTPISTISDGGSMVRLKEGAGFEEKKPMQAQNRSDFFNALRKKAALRGTASDNSERTEGTLKQKYVEVLANKGESIEDTRGLPEVVSQTPMSKGEDNTLSVSGGSTLDTGMSDEKVEKSVVGEILKGTTGLPEETVISSGFDSTWRSFIAVGSPEEEEAALLKSLGWVENSDEGEEPLTEEEINSFLREHMPAMASLSLRSQCGLRLRNLVVHTGKVGVTASGHSSSDVETNVESHV